MLLVLFVVACLSVGEALQANRMICWDHAPKVETNVLLHNIVSKGLDNYNSGKVIKAADADNNEYHYNLKRPVVHEDEGQVSQYSFDPTQFTQIKRKFMGYFEYDRLYSIYFVCPKGTVQCGLFCCPSSRVQQEIIAAAHFTDSSDLRRINAQTNITVGKITYALIKTNQQCEYKLQSSDELFQEVRFDNEKPIASVYFDCAPDDYCCQLECKRNFSASVEYARIAEPSTLKASSAFTYQFTTTHIVFICGVLFVALLIANYSLIKEVKRVRLEKPEEV